MISGIPPKAAAKLRRSGPAGFPAVGATLVLILALAAIAPRAAQGSAWDLARLGEVIAAAGSGTYLFSEERHLQVLTEPLHLEGTLSYTEGGQLVRRVTSPRQEMAVIDGNLLSIKTNKADPPVRVLLSDQPVLNALVVALRATLTGDVRLLKQTYDAELSGQEDLWFLLLTPRVDGLRTAVQEIRLEGSAHQIRRIEIFETSGDRSVITISRKI